MSDSEAAGLILETIHFAAEIHRDQRRKGADKSPYINHPIEVAYLLWDVGDIKSISVLQAAILHDAIEDAGDEEKRKEVRRKIGDEFGSIVSSIVKEVTDDKRLEKNERKRLQIEHASSISWQAQLVKLADKICNVSDIIENPPAKWDDTRKIEYLDWAEDVVARLRGVNPELEARFDKVMAKARGIFGPRVIIPENK